MSDRPAAHCVLLCAEGASGDQFAAVADLGTGKITFADSNLAAQTALTPTEEAFIDKVRPPLAATCCVTAVGGQVVNTVDASWDPATTLASYNDSTSNQFEGSDAWVRLQFEEYTTSLLCTVRRSTLSSCTSSRDVSFTRC